MKLVVGLGNPGSKYVETRHNVGFMVADELARRARAAFHPRFQGAYAEAVLVGQPVVLLKPMTYMNLSGESVAPCMRSLALPVGELVVIHDDLDLAPGALRIKWGGGHGGHNGLKSIFELLGRDFARVKIGIGRPAGSAVVNYVLSPFDTGQRPALAGWVSHAADAAEAILSEGLDRARNTFNKKSTKQLVTEGPTGPQQEEERGT